MADVYRRVYVLELDWNESNLRVAIDHELATLIPELQRYNFSVTRLLIPTKQSIETVQVYLKEFYRLINNEGSQGGLPVLIILYYNGHGAPQEHAAWNQAYAISGTKKTKIQWELLHEAFVEHSMYDHIIFMHSCFAAHAVPYLSHTNLPAGYEQYLPLQNAVNRVNQVTRLHIICGSDQNHYAYGGLNGLTLVLQRALVSLRGNAFTVEQLCGRMIELGSTTIAPGDQWSFQSTTIPPDHAVTTPLEHVQRLVHHPVSQLARNGPHRLIQILANPPEEFSRRNFVGKLQVRRQ
jgi:hypothetical protein